MKKLFYFLSVFIFVQSLSAQTKIAVKGGFNYSSARVYINDIKQSATFKAGFGAGLLFKMPFDGLLHFSPYIAYNLRGYKYTTKGAIDTTYDNSIHYIDLVPALSIDIPSGANSFVISAGPELGIAFSGKEKRTINGVTASSKMKFSTDGEYGYFDLGLSTSLGYHTKHFLVEAGFQFGLANINNDVDLDHRNIQNRMLSLNLGYYIK